ncbi:MAG: tryptophan-rich sensory protein [Clostridium sp.]|nr:tryptophan-rich sensory protein [Clostridium sp.]
MIHNKGYKVKFLAAITFIIVLIVNFLANYLPINGVLTSEVSDKYESLFTPAGFIFAIWGVIYILLLLFTIYQYLELRNKEPEMDDNYIEKVSSYFMISNIFNVLWILAWHYDLILLSTIFMVFIYIYLFLIMLQIKKSYNSIKDRFFIEIPFSIYFAWINVALLANLMAVYKFFKLDNSLNENLTVIIVILLGLIIISSMSIYFKSISYLLTGAVSYLAIFLNHIDPNKYNSNYKYIMASLIASFIIFIGSFIYIVYKKYIKKRSTIFSN